MQTENKRSAVHRYEQLAAILEYPENDVQTSIAECLSLLRSHYPEAKSYMEDFSNYSGSVNLTSLQELYSATFDLNAVCTLNIGFHIFGESYKRGTFLVGIQKMLLEHGLKPDRELPDYLPSILKLLVLLPKNDEYDSLIKLIVVPALAKMKKTFSGKSNCYGMLIRAIDIVIRQDHNLSEKDVPEVSPPKSDFFGCDLKRGVPGQCSFSQKLDNTNFELHNKDNKNV